MKRSEYWVVEDNNGNVHNEVFTSAVSAALACEGIDDMFENHAPHRVVPLIEHTDSLETLIHEAIANVDSVTSKDLREAILAVKEEVES